MSQASQLVQFVQSFWRAKKAWDTLPWLWVLTKADLASVNLLEPLMTKIDPRGRPQQFISCSALDVNSFEPIYAWLRRIVQTCPTCIDQLQPLAEFRANIPALPLPINWSIVPSYLKPKLEIVAMVRQALPHAWQISEYLPQLGLHIKIEIAGVTTNQAEIQPWIGEELLCYLDWTTPIEPKILEIPPPNHPIMRSLESNKLEVLPMNISTSLLKTIHGLGPSRPVLALLIDQQTKNVFWVCLNDYIDKISLPDQAGEFADATYTTIFVPTKNRIENNDLTIDILGFYTKRTKLLAAFSVFRAQKARLNSLKETELIKQAQIFARMNIHYDFWQSCRLWKPIIQLYHKLVHLADHGFVDPKMHKKAQKHQSYDEPIWESEWAEKPVKLVQSITYSDIMFCWLEMEQLASSYEMHCRSWFLPTFSG